MEITEVRIFPREASDRKLKAYATVTFENVFVVRNLKVIEGSKGLFVSMPSRKVREACPKCNRRNPIRSKFCSNCGGSLKMSPVSSSDDSRQGEHRDIAHPITQEFREYLQKKVLKAYDQEVNNNAGVTETSTAPASSLRSGLPDELSRVKRGADGAAPKGTANNAAFGGRQEPAVSSEPEINIEPEISREPEVRKPEDLEL